MMGIIKDKGQRTKRQGICIMHYALCACKGFTLIELLVAASIMGIVSLISVKLLFSTVMGKARQGSVMVSSGDAQAFLESLSKTVKEAKRINVDSTTEISSEGTVCRTFRKSGEVIEMAEDTSTDCSAPSAGFMQITSTNTHINNLNITKTDGVIDVAVSGYTEDYFGKHDFMYNTTIVKRTD
jgi:prepilin-type N-terminal cleavage/methylation domain-containing protein